MAKHYTVNVNGFFYNINTEDERITWIQQTPATVRNALGEELVFGVVRVCVPETNGEYEIVAEYFKTYVPK